MALNLSTLTSPATSGDVLAEALTTADFLEPVPVLRNLARGSQKGGDAKQDVALNQPKALPLIKNPAGNLGGYLYIPDVSGNYATGPSVTIGANQTWEAEVDMVITQYGNYIMPFGGGVWAGGFGIIIDSNGTIRAFSKTIVTPYSSAFAVSLNSPTNIKYGFDGTEIYVDINGQRVTDNTGGSAQANSLTNDLQFRQQTLSQQGNYAIQKAKLTVNSAVVFDCDFNGSTSIRHGDTKFNCVGGPVTLTRAGNDPVTVVKKSVLRFANKSDDTTGICLQGLLNQTIDGGYMFAAFSVLGDGGEDTSRIFSVNNTGGSDGDSQSAIFSLRNNTAPNDLFSYSAQWISAHPQMFDDDNGDILHESLIKNGTQKSLVNNAGVTNHSNVTTISAEEFNIVSNATGFSNSAIDLEYLALFDASITDAQAEDVRNYINNRNNVFSLIDSQGYYFFDGAATVNNQVFSGSSSWLGRIIGSDNDDPFKYLSNGSINDRPTTDGYKITFADNSDHFLFNTPLTGGQAGWQVVGTSLGTFAYRVNANAVTELNLLGNLGSASFRQAGDLYGVILLPESATGKDIEEARKLLIDRGAADGTTASTVNVYFYGRGDIVEFKAISFSSATSLRYTWHQMSSLASFPSLDLTNVVDVNNAWSSCASLSSFGTTEITNCTDFTGSWQSCSSLQSFPAGAKLGTAANNVNFTSAWQSSGLTSFSTPLPTATNVGQAWRDCNSLTSFSSELPSATYVAIAWYNCSSLTSFSTELPSVTDAAISWYNCSSLTDFSADVFSNWNPSSINSGVFNSAWENCSSLTAQSVENILTSIDASGKYGTSTGAAGGGSIDSGIDIDYNTATGSLSAATNTAIRSLDTKGWEVYINGEIRTGVELLDLQGFYFFESEGLAAANVTSWDSSIGASSVSLDLVGTQADGNDQPVADGTVVTFADNSDHIDITSTPQAGWQVVGTSLGTFAYRVNNTAVTELNLLGNAGVIRTAGDSYGMILLPESATGADIEAARKLLIDRGAADGTTSSAASNDWYGRSDIVEFKHINTSSLTALASSFRDCINLENFPALDLSNSNNFSSTWQGCSALQSFPAGAKLGTEASNVNFTSAWQDSGLTSFPALDLSSGTTFSRAWQSSDLISFPANIDLSSGIDFTDAWRNINTLLSFPAGLNLSSGQTFDDTWRSATSLTSFPLINISSGKRFRRSWYNCSSMTDWPSGFFDSWSPSYIFSGVFQETWDACSALTADSVGNILQSIDASNQHGTDDGTSTGNPLGDSGIDIDYDGTTLSAATNAAIDSLSGKGWEVYINGVLVIPNILDLAPAAAYSLRSFDADADPNVVNVRRSSDGATSDFKASEVSDGTLTSWVNTEYNAYTSDFSSGIDGWFGSNVSWSNSFDPLDANNYALKITAAGATSCRVHLNTPTLNIGQSYNIAAEIYIPSTNNEVDGVLLLDGYNVDGIFGDGEALPTNQWVTVMASGVCETNQLRIQLDNNNNDLNGILTSNAIGDIVYVKNVQVTQLTADGHVTTWYDQGGTNHATQSTASSQPKIVDGGTLVTDGSGNPAIIGDGVDDTLFHPTLTQSLDNTDFLVSAAYENSLALGVSGAVPRLYMTQAAMSYNNLNSITFSNQSGRNVLSFQTNGDAQEIFGNGTSLGTSSEAQANFSYSMFNVMQAGSGFSNGFLMEVVVFDENQVANRTGIENNINDTYTIY